MENITNSIIEKLNKMNSCGRYSEATVRKAVEETLKEREIGPKKERARSGCSKEIIRNRDCKNQTFGEFIRGTEIKLDKEYPQMLLIVKEEDGILTSYTGEKDLAKRFDFYTNIKLNLKDMVLEGIPDFMIDIVDKVIENAYEEE